MRCQQIWNVVFNLWKFQKKMIRSKYRCANLKNLVFSFCPVLKCITDSRFVFVFNCARVFNLCTCSLLHEISSLTSIIFLNSAKWKILEIQGSRVGIYYASFFIKFLQINNNIPCLLAAQTQIIFRLKFLCASHLKIKHFELPLLTKLNIIMKTKLTEMRTWCPILAVGCCWYP